MNKTISWLIISIGTLGLALYLFYIPPHQLLNKLTGGLGIYGFETELTLTSYLMEDQFGNLKSWQDFADKPLYLTIGFTACRLTCPVTMKRYQQMANITGDKVRYALLTIDPKNDTTQQLANYLGALNPEFVGLRVNDTDQFKKQISELQQVIYATGEQGNIEHKSYIYLIHPQRSGLIIYTKPDIDLMINDLNIIEMKEVKS